MSSGKGVIIVLIVGLIKKTLYKNTLILPKPFNSHFGDSIKVKIDLSNYATKTDIKNISHFEFWIKKKFTLLKN